MTSSTRQPKRIVPTRRTSGTASGPSTRRSCVRSSGSGAPPRKFIGDAVVAVLGAPRAHGDDAERAVRCGLAALDAIAEANSTGGPGPDFQVRAAVDRGKAVVSLDTEHERGEALATGDVLNTASGLQAAAPPGRLIVGAETYRAARRAIGYGPLLALEAGNARSTMAVAVESGSCPSRDWRRRRRWIRVPRSGGCHHRSERSWRLPERARPGGSEPSRARSIGAPPRPRAGRSRRG